MENLNECELRGRDESDICVRVYSMEVRVDDTSRTIGSLSECLKIGWVRMDGCCFVFGGVRWNDCGVFGFGLGWVGLGMGMVYWF